MSSMTRNLYRVTGRARAPVIFRREEGINVTYTRDGIPGLVRFHTRYRIGPSDIYIPHDMGVWIEAEADTLEEASTWVTVARELGNILSVGTNAAISPFTAELIYEVTPGKGERQFLQRFVPADGVTYSSRTVPIHAVGALMSAVATHEDRNRLLRAASHYSQALDDWEMGGELLIVTHLWMGVEAISPACLRKYLAERGATKEGLAEEWGFKPDRRMTLDAFLDLNSRIRLVLKDRPDLHKITKEVSDAFEHSTANGGDLFAPARDVLLPVAAALREAIVTVAGVSAEHREVILGKPFDVAKGPGGLEQHIRATLIGGEGDKLAPEGFDHPVLDWKHTIKTVTFEEASNRFGYVPEHTATPQLGPGVEMKDIRIEVFDGSHYQPKPAAHPASRDDVSPNADK